MSDPDDSTKVTDLTVGQLRQLIDDGTKASKNSSLVAEFRFGELRDRLNFQIALAQSALKNLMLVNGGALVALLTFVGNRATYDRDGIFTASACFSIGLTSILLAYFAAFWSQVYHGKATIQKAWIELKKRRKKADGAGPVAGTSTNEAEGEDFRWGATVLALVSLGFFVAGSFYALSAVT